MRPININPTNWSSSNWNLIQKALDKEKKEEIEEEEDFYDAEEQKTQTIDDLIGVKPSPKKAVKEEKETALLDDDNWNIDLGDIEVEEKEETTQEQTPFSATSYGTEITTSGARDSFFPGEHAVVGDFLSALKLLQKQIALIQAEPLREIMIDMYSYRGARVSLLPQTHPLVVSFCVGGKPLSLVSIEFLQGILEVS